MFDYIGFFIKEFSEVGRYLWEAQSNRRAFRNILL